MTEKERQEILDQPPGFFEKALIATFSLGKLTFFVVIGYFVLRAIIGE